MSVTSSLFLNILLTVYHYVSQQHNQLNTLSLSQTLYCVVILYMFQASSVHLQRHYTSSFWCELREVVAVGWLQVVGRLVYWAWGCGCRSGGLVGCGNQSIIQVTLILLSLMAEYWSVFFASAVSNCALMTANSVQWKVTGTSLGYQLRGLKEHWLVECQFELNMTWKLWHDWMS
jgi:hypothetical protein